VVCSANEWNEVFYVQINSAVANLQQKLMFCIMDHDKLSSDKFLS
jgi:Ca2+-dependent lipid-binding protein